MNRLIVAAAGSGKTQEVVNSAIANHNNVLITTYTDRNMEEIRQRIYSTQGRIPSNITILPWYTFVLKYFVRPYQDIFYTKDIRGVCLANGQSTTYVSEAITYMYYFSPDQRIYSDKMSRFAIKCLDYYSDAPIQNFARIYQTVFIDEVQDMAGYDLELIKRLILSRSVDLTCVGDPRQGVFFTSQTRKNAKYKRDGLISFFAQMGDALTIDNNLLNTNHRCPIEICRLSDRLYPSLPAVLSDRHVEDSHKGVYFIKECDVEGYIARYNPIQLVSSVRTKCVSSSPSLNIGQSKGGAFDRVLIYPSKAMINILLQNQEDSDEVRAKLYVALTRARISVGIVYNYKEDMVYEGVQKYISIERQ